MIYSERKVTPELRNRRQYIGGINAGGSFGGAVTPPSPVGSYAFLYASNTFSLSQNFAAGFNAAGLASFKSGLSIGNDVSQIFLDYYNSTIRIAGAMLISSNSYATGNLAFLNSSYGNVTPHYIGQRSYADGSKGIAIGNGTTDLAYFDIANNSTNINGPLYVNSSLNVTGNLNIIGNINRYNQTELNIGDTFINLGTAQETAINGGIRLYNANGSTLITKLEYNISNSRWIFDKSILANKASHLLDFELCDLIIRPTSLVDNETTTSIALASSTSNNYGYTINTLRTINGNGNFDIRYHYNSNIGVSRLFISQNGLFGFNNNNPTYPYHFKNGTVVIDGPSYANGSLAFLNTDNSNTTPHYIGQRSYADGSKGIAIGNGTKDLAYFDIANSKTTLSSSLDVNSYVNVGEAIGASSSVLIDLLKNQNSSTRTRIGNFSTGKNAFAAHNIESSAGILYLYNFGSNYLQQSRTGKSEINSNSTNGLQIVSTNGLFLKNYINDDVLSINNNIINLVGLTVVSQNISSPTFVSGWAGAGWRIQTSNASAEFSDITVRGTLSVYELLIQQLRATNGSVIVSASAKIDSITISTVNSEVVVFEDPSNHNICPFSVNDIILVQRFRLDSTTVVKRYFRRVASVNGKTVTFAALSGSTNAGVVEVGDEVVRIGNTTNFARQGLVYITADDSNAPYIDVVSGVNSHAAWLGSDKTKVRLGKLDGIIDPLAGLYGQTDYFGLYANNVHLRGHINATTGNIGGFVIANDAIFNTDNGDQFADGATYGFELGKYYASSRRQVVCFNSTGFVMMYSNGESDMGIIGSASGNTLFQLGTTNKIAAFTFDSSTLYTGTKQTTNDYTVNKTSMTLGSNYIRMHNFRVDTDGSFYARSGKIGQLQLDSYGLYTSVRQLAVTPAGTLEFGSHDYNSSIGIYMNDYISNVGGAKIGDIKLAAIGKLHSLDDFATWSTEYGIEVMKRTGSSTYKHILRAGGSSVKIAGFNYDYNKQFIGTGTFANSNTAYYVDNSGNFSLTDKFVFNNTTATLSINGLTINELAIKWSDYFYITDNAVGKIPTARIGSSSGRHVTITDTGILCATSLGETQWQIGMLRGVYIMNGIPEGSTGLTTGQLYTYTTGGKKYLCVV